MQKITLHISFFILVFLSSCSKDRRPVIKILTPLNEQVVNSPELVQITADITDSDAVTSEYLFVTKVNGGTDTVLNFKDYEFSPGTYHLNKSFMSEPNTRYKIVISAYGHSNLSADSIFIKSN